MQLDAAGVRQLRFSLSLQSAAGLMLIVAFGVRVTSVGWDAITFLLLLGVVIVGAAWTWTFRTLRDNRRRADS